MPPRLDTDYRTEALWEREQTEHDNLYAHLYPEGVNLRPGSKTHEKLKNEILLRARESERFMSVKHPQWKEVDETLTAYIPLDKDERKVELKDIRRPVSIVVPESYAVLETLLTYFLAAFGESPVFRLTGEGPEDELGAILLEKTVDMQVKKAKALLALHTHWRDAFSYGIGIAAVRWRVKTGKRSVVEDLGYYDLNAQFVKTGATRSSIDAVLFEGSEIDPIDPYNYLPDPNVPLHQVQDAEYVMWKDYDSFNSLLRDEMELGSVLFNVRYLKGRTGRSSIYMHESSGRETKSGLTTRRQLMSPLTHPIDTLWCYWDLIPKQYGLPGEDAPEKWMFALAGDETIIAAHPMGLNHNMFPVAVCAPDFGGHELMPVSRLEMMYGIQKVINFYFNSHMRNVRKALNNMFVVDPKIINMHDVLTPSDGKVIRTKKSVWGKSLREAIDQLDVKDVTSNHMGDMLMARSVGRNVTAAVDSVQGLQRTKGERVTAEEFRDTRMAALSRLQKAARVTSLQSHYDLALMYAYHTQQFMSEETYVKVAGRWEEVLREEYGVTDPSIKVSPFDLNVAFDVDIHDGSVQGGEFADNWILLYQIMAANPEIAQSLDSVRVFLHIARLLGAKNVHEFLKKGGRVGTQTLPDQQVAEQAQQGNLAPLEEMANV